MSAWKFSVLVNMGCLKELIEVKIYPNVPSSLRAEFSAAGDIACPAYAEATKISSRDYDRVL